jgi:hypothetical protein
MSVRPSPAFSAACALKKMPAARNLRISSTTRSARVTGTGRVAGSVAAAGARRNLVFTGMEIKIALFMLYSPCILFYKIHGG